MITDLTHNKIISDTLTDKFIASADSVLVKLVRDAFGDSAIAIQMYEDHLSDGFTRDGRWFYPLTVLTDNGAEIFWISWSVDKKHFRGAVPYSYVGDAPIDFRAEEDVPEEFVARLEGRNIYAPSDYIKIKLHTASEDALFLSGKYSQTFIDEMARQLTDEISRAMLVSGLDEAELSLQMIFAPDTYMEHTSENVTYRRLRLTDKTSAPRDFWIKWTRTNAAVAYSVSDTPILGTIKFELGEDVPHKIREKEYRFMLKGDADKYHNAMSRKNVTEWRELIKRAIKRGELEKQLTDTAAVTAQEDDDKLNALLASIAASTSAPSSSEHRADEPDSALNDVLRKLLEEDTSSEAVEEIVDTYTEEPEQEAEPEAEEATEKIEADVIETSENVIEDTETADEPEKDETAYEELTSEPEKMLVVEEIKENDRDETEISDDMREQMIRAEIEAKVRLEYESIARMKAEEEAKRLLEEQERLRRENERLQAEARRAEEIRAKEEAARAEREAKLKAEIEAKMRAEAREKERLQEAAMLAIEQKRKLEREREEAERKAEEARLKEAERRAAEERAREEENRRLEAERARHEEEERLARERREAERARAETEAEKAKETKKGYTFTSKRVMFFFRASVDPNITEPMEAIIRSTLESTGKTNVPINIRASVIDEKSVCLDFVRIPEEEEELLIKIVQALGQGGLGIVKARVE